VKSKGKEWFQHSESFTGNLDLAFKLWDAVSSCSFLHGRYSRANIYIQVHKGTQNAGKEFKEAKLWDDANKWLAERR
jgi:hypothetical protein